MSSTFEHKVILSHNEADKPHILRLKERLHATGLRICSDEWVIQLGDDIYLAIERGLEAARTLVLCLSPAALGWNYAGLERNTVILQSTQRLPPLSIKVFRSKAKSNWS